MQRWAALFLCLCLSAPCGAQDLHLDDYRKKDDLSGWIYAQLPWVAASPATRYPLLVRAVSDAWRLPRGDAEAQAWQDLLVNEGYALLQAGDVVRSTDAYTSAFQWARGHQEIQDDSLVLENILKPLGNNYTRLGDYEQALFIQQKALSIALALGNNEEMAGTYSNLANTEGNRGNPLLSLDYCTKGLALTRLHPALEGLLLSQEADALRSLGRSAEAKASIRQSLRLLTQGDSHDWLLVAYQQAGDVYRDDPAAALAYYRQALGLEGLMHRREKAKLFLRLGDLFLEKKQPAAATAWLDSCLSTLVERPLASLRDSDLYAENTLADVLFSLGRAYSAMDSVDGALRCYRLSFSAEKELRNELVSGPARERAVTESHARRETAIQLAWEAWQATGLPRYRQEILDFMESSKAQLLLQEVQQQEQLAGPDSIRSRILLLERALAYYSEEKDPRFQQVQWDLATLRRTVRRPAAPPQGDIYLSDTESIRSFFAGAGVLYVVECDRRGISFADRVSMGPGWQDSIRQFLRVYFASGPGPMIDHPRAYVAAAYALYAELFGRHPLQAGRRYILMPDGALALLPVEALVTTPTYSPDPGNWPFVLRTTQVSYAWSLQTLRLQVLTKGNQYGFSGFFISRKRSLPELKAVTAEETSLRGLVRSGMFYTDSLATVSAFGHSLERSAVVHVASHATGDGDVPDIEFFDRPFYPLQLADVAAAPTLVVLSACQTGNGRLVAGEGAQSIARAFTAAGTNTVVASWWNVNDAVTAGLVKAFYAGLSRGRPAAAALREAQLGWIGDPGVPYLQKLPYYWAALHCQGNPAPSMGAFHTGLAWYWLAAILFLCLTPAIIKIIVTRRR